MVIHSVNSHKKIPFSIDLLTLACGLALPLTVFGDTQLIADGENKDVTGQTYEHSTQYQYAVRATNGGVIVANDVNAIGHGNGGYGILSENAGSRITFNGGRITTDDQADAVTAADKGVVVLNSVEIHTTGVFGNAVVSNDGRVTITNSTINNEGVGATGLTASNGGHISAENVDVSSFRGILASTGGMIDGTGLRVRATGNFGVRVHGGSGINLENSSIETIGAGATAVSVDTSSHATLKTVQIKTTGDNSIALVSSDSTTSSIESSMITTSGYASHGVLSQVNSSVDARNVDVVTSGNASIGLFGASNIDFHNGSVQTNGNASIAVLAQNGGIINVGQSDILTRGAAAHGLMISRDGGTISAVDSRVNVEGAGSSVLISMLDPGQHGHFSISDSNLRADQGIAIRTGLGVSNIELKNSSVDSGIGALFANLSNTGSSALVADASNLNGDVSVDSIDYDADFTLINGSLWSGTGNGIDTLALAKSEWLMTGDSSVRNLTLDGGSVVFDHADGLFKTLSTESLSGNGRFLMNTDLASQQGDLLVVRGAGMALGDHQLVVGDSGHEPANVDGRLQLVETHGGDAKFNLYGNHVDAGAFRYILQQQGDDWFLTSIGKVPVDQENPEDPVTPIDPAPENLSKGANAAVAAHTASATLWSAQMNALVKRLGELRMGKDEGGVWTRGISKRLDIHEKSSRAFTQNVTGLELGADKAIAVNNGKVYVGGMVGAARGDLNFGEGASGTTDSKMVGAYATYLNDNGIYVDTVLKHSHFDNDIKLSTNLGEPVKGSYKTNGVGAEIEVGKHIKFGDGWFVEPQLQLTATRTQGASYTASNGLKVKTEDIDSLQSRVGSLFGRSLELSNGMRAQPYVKASYITEHAGSSKVNVNGNKLDADLPGNRLELGFGGVLQVSEKSKVSLDVEYAKGKSIEQPLGINVGYRYLW